MKQKRQRKSKPSLMLIVSTGIVSAILITLIVFINTPNFYFNLANPTMRHITIVEGLRKEQIADKIGNVLGWDTAEKNILLSASTTLKMDTLEGKYFPSTYLISVDTSPLHMSAMMLGQYNIEMKEYQKTHATTTINMDAALKIASIIQREYGKLAEMPIISGIIWNRLFNGMSLDMDATLQYAKGSEDNGWWPRVVSADKKIVSPYNTYKNVGLPPTPISNPGIASIDAALHPAKTSCLFYFHDKNKIFRCSKTYEEHVAKINKYLK
jgi:UPF0755 protein